MGQLTCKCSIWDHNKCPEYGGALISEVQIIEVFHCSTIMACFIGFVYQLSVVSTMDCVLNGCKHKCNVMYMYTE